MLPRLGRTLSNPDRRNDDALAKEIFLSDNRHTIDTMTNNGQITETQAQTIYSAINHYVQFSGGQTRRGFEKGLTQLIATQLENLLQITNTTSPQGN